MPWQDLAAKKAYAKKYHERRRLEKQARLGPQTDISLRWPKPQLPLELAYWIAACIDCEGCISLGSYWNKMRSSYNYGVKMQLQMTHKSIPEELKALCGGTIHFSLSKNPRRKDIWTWSLPANGVRWLLPQILPYLRVKKQVGTLMVEFLTIVRKGTPRRGEHNPRAQQIRAMIAALNQRGKPHGGKLSEPLAPLAQLA